MAETREILIEIEVDNSQAQKTLERTTSQLRVLQDERKELNKQVRQSSAQLKAEGTTRAEVNRRIVENGLATKRLTEERRRATKEVNLENNSLNALRNNLANLTRQRNNQNTSTREGAKRFQELNRQIAAQNKEIRNLEEAGGDFRRNVGNYQTALNQVIPSFGALTSGIIGATKAALAFIATPLGAVLAALGLALGAVVQFFTRTQEGAEKLRVITATLTTGVDVLIDTFARLGGTIVEAVENPQEAIKSLGESIQAFLIRRVQALVDGLGLLGSAVSKLFEGEFESALDDAAEGAKKLVLEVNPLTAVFVEVGEAGVEAFEDIAEEAAVAAQAAGVLENQLIAIEKAENDLILTRARANKEIAVLRQQAEDRSNSEEERIQFLLRAAEIEQQVLDEEIRIAQERARIIIEQNKLTESLEEDRRREIEALAQVEQLQQRSFNLQKSLTSRLEGIRREADAAENKRAAEAAKREQERIDRLNRERDAELELRAFRLEQAEFDAEAEIQLEKDKRDRLLENEKLTESERILIQEQTTARINALQKQETDFAIAEQQRKRQAAEQSLSIISQTLGALASVNKDFAVAQAIVDGILAVQKTIASVPYPLNIPLAAAQGVQALNNVNRIRSTNTPKFALGGMVNGPSHANGGVKFAVGGQVNELEGGEAVINKRSTAMFKPILSALNVAGGGVKFADGGIINRFQNGGVTSNTSADAINAQVETEQAIENAISNQPTPVVRVSEINNVQNAVTVTEQTASL